MLPAAPFAFLILLALLPGWVFVRLSEKMGPRPDRSPLTELLELAAAGLSALTTASLIVAGLSLRRNSGFFNVESWARTRHQYLGDHLGAALASTTMAIFLSCVLAVVFWLVLYGRRPAGFRAGSSVWMDCLAHPPSGMANWIGVHRRDGSLVEGLLHSFTAGPGDDTREISLKGPIRLTPANGNPCFLALDRVIVPGEEITTVTVVHVPKQNESDHAPPATTSTPSSS